MSITLSSWQDYPKKRTVLPEEYKSIYEEHMKNNRTGKGVGNYLSSKMEAWMHKKVAESVAGKRVLEVGAGTLNHIEYETQFDTYDVIEPSNNLLNQGDRSQVSRIYSGIEEIPEEKKYDKILSIAVFEHILDLPDMMQRISSLLSPNGALVFGIPAEGGLLWTLGWKLTTGVQFRMKYKLSYDVIMKHEHVNTAKEIEAITRSLFFDVKVRYLGFNPQFSFYHVLEARRPRIFTN